MNWIEFKGTYEEIETFSCGTVLMLRDCSVIMLGDGQTVEHDIAYYSNELVDKVKQIKNPVLLPMSDKYFELINLLANGLEHAVIAKKMSAATATIHSRVSKIKQRYGCKTVPQLVYTLAKQNLI